MPAKPSTFSSQERRELARSIARFAVFEIISLTSWVGDSESRLLSEWTLVVAFRILSLENLALLFTALLLEAPIVVVSGNLNTLSNVV